MGLPSGQAHDERGNRALGLVALIARLRRSAVGEVVRTTRLRCEARRASDMAPRLRALRRLIRNAANQGRDRVSIPHGRCAPAESSTTEVSHTARGMEKRAMYSTRIERGRKGDPSHWTRLPLVPR
jgi:hypothetical protein